MTLRSRLSKRRESADSRRYAFRLNAAARHLARQDFKIRLIVVHYQDAATLEGQRRANSLLNTLLRHREAQREPKIGAAARYAAHTAVSAHQIDQSPHDGQ